MALYVHRSQRVEALVSGLMTLAPRLWGTDPFDPAPIVVGSRGMERWLRQEFATHLGSAARLQFLFPRTAFDAIAAWDGEPGGAPDWDVADGDTDPWSGAALAARVLVALRSHAAHPSFQAVRDYLGAGNGPVLARELAFATDVAGVIERLCYDRPTDARSWAANPSAAPEEHQWLATVLGSLVAGTDTPSPAEQARALDELPTSTPSRASLAIFGLSTLRPGDRLRIMAASRRVDVHLFLLTPSSAWWADFRSKPELIRAVDRERDPARAAALLAESGHRNTLLANNGIPSRDLQVWLESLEYRDGAAVAQEGDVPLGAETLLSSLQAWVDAAEDNPEGQPWASLGGCPSVEVTASHGPLRECEALRDALLRRFQADPTLEPRHVLIMTPDLATYAPLLSAVFARGSETVPPIPLEVADLGVSSTNGFADALLQALQLADERVTATRVLDLLGNAFVRARWRLTEEDVPDLRTMVIDSGIRWAWNAEDRQRHRQPALDVNTVRFGLERLALGSLMHDPGEFFHLRAANGLEQAVPFDVGTRDRVARFGQFADFCASLEAISRESGAASASGWRTRLSGWLDRLTAFSASTEWLRVQVEDALAEALPDDCALEFDRSAVQLLLQTRFEVPRAGDRPATAAATLCALEPMRSVPFRVIALLGMDDGSFPRNGRPAAWDPFATPRPGEDDRRSIDRHMFLEAVLCARDALLVSGTGFEPKRGQRMPLSVVVTELAEVVSSGTGVPADPEPVGDAVIRRMRLQPWSEGAFTDPHHRPFDAVWRAGAQSLRADPKWAGIRATHPQAPWPSEEFTMRHITANQLGAALAQPQRELLGHRLGIELTREDAEVKDREPLETMDDADWAVRRRALDALLAQARSTARSRAEEGGDAPHPDSADLQARVESLVDALTARLRGEGVLPLRERGRMLVRSAVAEALQARAVADQVGGTLLAESPTWRCELRFDVLDGEPNAHVFVTSTAPEVRRTEQGDELVWTLPGKAISNKHLLIAWTTLLAAALAPDPARPPVVAAHLVTYCRAAPLTIAAVGPETARAALEALVRAYRITRRAPALLFESISRPIVERLVALEAMDADLAEQRRASPDASPSPPEGWLPPGPTRWREVVLAREVEWEGPLGRQEVWVKAIFGDLDIEDLARLAVVPPVHDGASPTAGDVITLAEQVWRPVLAAIAARDPKDAASTPRRKTGGGA